MIFHPRALRTGILTTGFAALMGAALGGPAWAGGNLDASYTVSFGRIRAGGLMKALVDGEGSFSMRGTITDDHPVPTKFSSKIVSNAETSDVTMVLDEGSVKELVASPPPNSSRVPVTEANRQGIVD